MAFKSIEGLHLLPVCSISRKPPKNGSNNLQPMIGALRVLVPGACFLLLPDRQPLDGAARFVSPARLPNQGSRTEKELLSAGVKRTSSYFPDSNTF